ncbi:MAG: MBL fold metallo-hydrolase [Vicinamibacteria bacterium]
MATLAERLLRCGSTALLTGGERDARRSFLNHLAPELERLGATVVAVTADLGLPFLGPPGAVTRARPRNGEWVVERIEALCTLDAARFRLPLLLACRRALEDSAGVFIIVEVPRLTRGMASSELLTGLVEAMEARAILSLGGTSEMREDLAARGVEVFEMPAEKGPSVVRATARTELWNEFLEDSNQVALSLDALPVTGAPPPRSASDAWSGRQVALTGSRGETLAFGEVLSLANGILETRVRVFAATAPGAIVLRDARRDGRGLLSTDRSPEPRTMVPRGGEEGGTDLKAGAGAVGLRPPIMTLASAKALLVNGIFGDPLLHVRLRHRKRSLLFDLGETARLPARIVHQVSDVFISHAHFDHIGGFLWLLRSSIGSPRPRSLYGPPGLADHIEGMIAGIHWDRIGDRGPVFHVTEVHGGKLERFRLQAGRRGQEPLEGRELREDVLLEEPEFRVRAAVLDHGIPVLSFAFEETAALHVRAQALSEMGLAPGPWLSHLKRLLLESRGDEAVALPDGSTRRASDLEAALIYSRPGQKLVYATDLDDSEENHRALSALASEARVLFCEAAFVEEDRDLARATQHLTARSCARIAASARVEKLVPFHFSKRYEDDPGRVYREVMEIFPSAVVAR